MERGGGEQVATSATTNGYGPRLGRRAFLRRIGRSTAGVLVVTALPACTDGALVTSTDAASVESRAPTPAWSTASDPSRTAGAAPVDWRRVDLDVVSAYVLVRSVEAAIVDTGLPGSVPAISEALVDFGMGWADVAHVILTHRHPDHVGSAANVLTWASNATAYAGAGDAAVIDAPTPVLAVRDGDTVFGLRIIATPGHTPGHISVLDEAGGLLVAGDALVGGGDAIRGPEPRFTHDLAMANDSVRKLAGYRFDTAVFGHGEPVTANADALVVDLATRLSQAPSPSPHAVPSDPGAPRPSFQTPASTPATS